MHFVFPIFATFCHLCRSAFNFVSSCNYGRNCLLSGTTTYLRCNDVAESFSDGAELYKGFMSFLSSAYVQKNQFTGLLVLGIECSFLHVLGSVLFSLLIFCILW
jgi:hypothetical protein